MPEITSEVPINFNCDGVTLVGILHIPSSVPSLGMVIIVGGPQYRVGSHRQFVLLARTLAARGIAALRFDCRGMGDSDGEFRGFENIEPDIAAAIGIMLERLPSIKRLALWGLCDATSAICSHAGSNTAIKGVALVNPWVRTEAGHARAQLKHYYLARVIEGAFLRKLLSGEVNFFASAGAFLRNLGRAFLPPSWSGKVSQNPPAGGSLAERMADNLRSFHGRILLITSGRDLTAKEFEDAAGASTKWRRLSADTRLMWHRLSDADHTFSRRAWRDQVARWTAEWIEDQDW